MLRDNLLTRAAEAGADDTAIDLARRFTCADDICAAMPPLEQAKDRQVVRSNRWDLLGVASIVAFLLVWAFVVFLTEGDGHHLQWEDSAAYLVLGSFFLMALAIYKSVAAFIQGAFLDDQLRFLAPIADTRLCQEALQYVETGYPDVLAWRDLALAERDQLYAFDVEVMRRLHQKVDRDRSREKEQGAMAEACRKVHGLVIADIPEA